MNRLVKILAAYRQKISYVQKDIGSLLGMNTRFFKEARGTRIVLYHGICLEDHTRFNNIFLRLKTFEAHLQFYKEYFHIISLEDYYQQHFSKDRFNICITFDDGYANNYNYVLPLLEQYQVPATFFITAIRDAGYDILWNDFLNITGKYGPEKLTYRKELFRKRRFNRYVSVTSQTSLVEILRSGGFNPKAEMMELLQPLVPFRGNKAEEDYWLQMTEMQIGKLSASEWVTIGCHGYYHNDLARIGIDEAENEILQSKQYLERVTGKEIKALAFPYGTYSRAVVSAAKKKNFTRLLALDFHFREDHADQAMRERFTVNPFISINNQMIAIIKGTYAF